MEVVCLSEGLMYPSKVKIVSLNLSFTSLLFSSTLDKIFSLSSFFSKSTKPKADPSFLSITDMDKMSPNWVRKL